MSNISYIRDAQQTTENHIFFKTKGEEEWSLKYLKAQLPFLILYSNQTATVIGKPERIIIISKDMTVSTTVKYHLTIPMIIIAYHNITNTLHI